MRALCILLFLLTATALFSQTDSTGSIRGFVYDAKTGEGMPFAIVKDLTDSASTTTDVYGFYQLKNLSPGFHDLCVIYYGYTNDTVRATKVLAGHISQTDFHVTSLGAEPETIKVVPVQRIPNIDTDPLATKRKRMLLVGGTETILAGGSLAGLYQIWYKQYPHSSFHFFNDNREWLQMDKIGHAQSAYTTGFICTHLWYWTGMNRKKAIWIGGLSGFAYQAVIETMDGFSDGWGFSSGDIIANATGSALFISQELLWHDQRIQPKFSFHQSGLAHYRPDLLGSNYIEQMVKDYNGQTYWWSVNVASFLSSETHFPKWLNIAIGYGANGMTGGNENPPMYNAQGNTVTLQRYRQYYLSFDIDLRKLPVKSRFLRTVFTAFSFIKIPAPGLELSNGHVHPLIFAF